MKIPKFLVADCEDFPENTYVVHTQHPSFIMDADTEEYQILDGSEPETSVIAGLIADASAFYESELDRYEEDENI